MITKTTPVNAIRFTLGAAIASFFAVTSTANAAGVITSIVDVGSLGGTVISITVDNSTNEIDINKVFDAIQPITLRFTVEHGQGGPGSYALTETVINSTDVTWTDYHFSIVDSVNGNGITFGSFQSATLDGFDLDSPPDSGPRNLNFTGVLAAGGSMDASFSLQLSDPGANNSYTFDLVQTPTVSAVPIPAAAWLFASGLLGLVKSAKRRGMSAQIS